MLFRHRGTLLVPPTWLVPPLEALYPPVLEAYGTAELPPMLVVNVPDLPPVSVGRVLPLPSAEVSRDDRPPQAQQRRAMPTNA
jgi:hypothetical protein